MSSQLFTLPPLTITGGADNWSLPVQPQSYKLLSIRFNYIPAVAESPMAFLDVTCAKILAPWRITHGSNAGMQGQDFQFSSEMNTVAAVTNSVDFVNYLAPTPAFPIEPNMTLTVGLYGAAVGATVSDLLVLIAW